MTPARQRLAACRENGRPLNPKGGNDRVYTPDALAARIVAHFKPDGRRLEPCRGTGAFERAMPGCDWCEIDEGRDFLQWHQRVDWIVTNPPWSKFRLFLQHSMRIADDVVFLTLLNHFFTKARIQDMRQAKFGIVEIVTVPTPPLPWPQAGLQSAAIHIRRGHVGPTKFTHW